MSRIDRYLAEIRKWNEGIEIADRRVAHEIATRDRMKARGAEMQGRVAFLEGRPKGRNPFQAPLSREWNKGWTAESRNEPAKLPPIGG